MMPQCSVWQCEIAFADFLSITHRSGDMMLPWFISYWKDLSRNGNSSSNRLDAHTHKHARPSPPAQRHLLYGGKTTGIYTCTHSIGHHVFSCCDNGGMTSAFALNRRGFRGKLPSPRAAACGLGPHDLLNPGLRFGCNWFRLRYWTATLSTIVR